MRKSSPWNLLMITLDCVRPDHLGCYGYGGVETPHLDALAAQGILFEQAVTHAPNTWVAHATLFTSSLPSRHGLRAPAHRLSLGITTLPEWLSTHGYSTAAFPGNSLVGRAQGFHRGFLLFDEPATQSASHHQEILWRRDWGHVLQRTADWLKTANEPFFLWVHYIETHHLPDYHLPQYFKRAFSPKWQHYDGKISYADQVCIGEILSLLERRGIRDRTIIIILSDHGEELHANGRPLHDGGLRDDVIRVPLILWLPAVEPLASSRVSEQVRLMDLFPTACDLLEIPPPHGIQGQSLLPVVMDRSHFDEEASLAYLENWPKGYLGLRSPEWKLILRNPCPGDGELAQSDVQGLYHLRTDPLERLDLCEKHPSVLQYLRGLCIQWSRGGPSLEVDPADQEHMERVLKGLGYL